MNHAPLSPPNPQSESASTTEPTATLPFVPYTHFPKAEAEPERHLGQGARLLMRESWREKWVQYTPWLALAFLPVQLYAVLVMLFFSSFAFVLGEPMVLVSTLFSAAAAVCQMVALPGLFRRGRSGWTFLLYSHALVFVDCMLGLDLATALFVVAILWATFQIKYRYS